MLNDLNNRNLLTKIKDINDQRKLSIILSSSQLSRIEYLLKEIDDYLAHHFKYCFFQTATDSVKYLIQSQQVIKKLTKYLSLCDLSIEEIYVLGILSLYDHRLTIKELQYEQQHQFMTVSPIIKKLIEKKLVSKTRTSHDERCVAIQIMKDKRSKINKIIEACYNFLEKGIKYNH
ncbi:transcriptional regulator [Staphylococcus simiae]|uniref:transcriptional regulator, SarA/Rot family n=1 Tax=Staphylococcus simiae TaxID=308354 RepID=UPI001A974613|nr:transcriptional regulator [Staphylococcus simiae]MBO1199839.1 transcriptional regulator [Staphylococcus simiae]MBO1201944.1 transcriptional regulator [Staphylococcus simiae]MBO1204177.1 transcriptional regulator [Staphylococcus simiae]MBO1211888.1 transcriptional regulator [Staphylococcus simiae]MBO1230393.1 transcriptional regulator [Staphylococcus simiae]